MKKNFETRLPEGYTPAKTLDVSDKKTSALMLGSVLVFSVLALMLCNAIFHPDFSSFESGAIYIEMIAFLAYMTLHELTHGAAFKLLTGQKLTFGFKFPAAYCGMPDVYMNKKTSLISALAPFVVFNIVFLLGAILLPTPAGRFFSAALLIAHIGGCVGDLYVSWLLLTKFHNTDVLTRDFGVKQVFYTKAALA